MSGNIARQLGRYAERQALEFLQKRGLSLLAQNYSSRLGEIDLIMLDSEALVFIEVRRRSSEHFGGAFASVTAQKQKKLILTAQYFLLKNPQYTYADCRFDVISIPGTARSEGLDWLQNAFCVND